MSLPTPTLHTARLRLRPFTSADADALYALRSSAHVLRYWDAPPWSERARAERFIAACRQMADEGSGARLAVDRVSDGAFIGWCSLSRWNPDYRSASMGYCLDDAAWGHGYATEAARVLLQWAFDALALNRVQAETDTRNAAVARAAGPRPLNGLGCESGPDDLPALAEESRVLSRWFTCGVPRSATWCSRRGVADLQGRCRVPLGNIIATSKG